MQRDCGSKSIDLAGMLVVSFDKVFSNLSQGSFFSTSLFLPFMVHCYFVAILKSSADTNAGQNGTAA